MRAKLASDLMSTSESVLLRWAAKAKALSCSVVSPTARDILLMRSPTGQCASETRQKLRGSSTAPQNDLFRLGNRVPTCGGVPTAVSLLAMQVASVASTARRKKLPFGAAVEGTDRSSDQLKV